MSREYRPWAIRICMLIVSAVLLGATVGEVASRPRAADVAAARFSARASKPGVRSHNAAASRRARCAKATRVHKRHNARKACAVKTAKRRKRSIAKPKGITRSVPPAPVVPTASVPSSPASTSPPVETAPPVSTTNPVEAVAPFRFFAPSSVWNAPLATNAPLDPSSAAVVGAFNAEIAKEGPGTINTSSWSVPVYTVPANQPLVKVTLIASRRSLSPTLQTAWEAVPLPANAQPAAGTDMHLVVWQPSTDKLWEFWRLEKTSAGWQASWGGAIENASSDSGAYGPEAWSGAQTGWGASASSLSIAGGLITLEDLEKGQINHALAMALPDTRAGVYASPAKRTDGTDTEPLSLPEGAHLRLDPNLNLASLHLPHLTLMMAEAAQHYGIIIRDTASNIAFYGQDPTPTATEPYTGTHGYYEGKTPHQILEAFPWSHLQLLKMELHNTN
jgi:hypothetical protein